MSTTETIAQMPLADLHESPFNPRKTFTGVDELADNIKAEGRIHQPLLVRPRIGPLFAGDLAATAGYEVVFGHRRLRAAEAAGLATVPCMVRAMTDAEARSAQIAENLARADVHPIEEAEGFAVMIQQDGISAEALAAKVGKSISYVYARVKLLQACAEIRQACLAGQIGSEVALLIARLRTDKLQQKALAAIRNDTSTSAKLDDGGKRSFRHIRDLLAEKFTLDLKGAIFDREDATLLPTAGVCSACPKRTGNAPEYADLAALRREGQWHGHTAAGGPNTCTDPDCFDAKKQAHLTREAAQLQRTGKQVITGNKARAAISAQGEVKGDESLMWQLAEQALVWSRVAELTGELQEPMRQQLEVVASVVRRFGTTGRVGYSGAEYQAAKAGIEVMDQLAALVEKRQAIEAACWAEQALQDLRAPVEAERLLERCAHAA